MDYGTFRAKPWDERVQLFNSITSHEKAELVRTHIRSWLNLHRERLTPEQIQVMEENIAFVTEELYEVPKREENLRYLKELEARTATFFSREDMREALTMHWDQVCHIRPK